MGFKEKDFIEIEYTGKTVEEGAVFDTTDIDAAKKNDIFNEHVTYGPVVVCLGEGHILKGLEKRIIGKEPGSYEFELQPEEAFGKKEAKLIQLISTGRFKKQGINPMPGLQVNIDGYVGIVKAVSGGRTIVDFNNPLSSKAVKYTIKINKAVEDAKSQIEAVAGLLLHMKPEVQVTEGKATLTLADTLPEELQKMLREKIAGLTKVKEITFLSKKTEAHQEQK